MPRWQTLLLSDRVSDCNSVQNDQRWCLSCADRTQNNHVLERGSVQSDRMPRVGHACTR